jgi:hypothetical protein
VERVGAAELTRTRPSRSRTSVESSPTSHSRHNLNQLTVEQLALGRLSPAANPSSASIPRRRRWAIRRSRRAAAEAVSAQYTTVSLLSATTSAHALQASELSRGSACHGVSYSSLHASR